MFNRMIIKIGISIYLFVKNFVNINSLKIITNCNVTFYIANVYLSLWESVLNLL